VSSNRRGSVLTVAVAGDIDHVSGAAGERAVAAAVTTVGITAVEVDLSDVGFLDSSGIALLLKGRRSADEHGVRFRVTGVHGIVQRVLDITGVSAHLSGEPDLR